MTETAYPEGRKMVKVIRVNKGLFGCETCKKGIVRRPGQLQRFCSKKCRKNRK